MPSCLCFLVLTSLSHLFPLPLSFSLCTLQPSCLILHPTPLIRLIRSCTTIILLPPKQNTRSVPPFIPNLSNNHPSPTAPASIHSIHKWLFSCVLFPLHHSPSSSFTIFHLLNITFAHPLPFLPPPPPSFFLIALHHTPELSLIPHPSLLPSSLPSSPSHYSTNSRRHLIDP